MKRPSNQVIIKALNDHYGILTYAAKQLSTSRVSIAKWVNSDPELQQAWVDSREMLHDLVENQLIENIKAGKETSLIWYTKTQMRKRGYQERFDIDVTNRNIQITFQQEGEVIDTNRLIDGKMIELIGMGTNIENNDEIEDEQVTDTEE